MGGSGGPPQSSLGKPPVYHVEVIAYTSESVASHRPLATTVGVVLVWFFFNISMASLTKWTYLYVDVCSLQDEGEVCGTYRFPFMVTVVHMLFSWLMSMAILIHRGEDPRCKMSLATQAQKILPLALAFSVSVAAGNLSLKFIYPSFNQMLASVSPLITVFMSVVIRRKQYNRWTWISMPVICGGLLVCSSEEVNYNSWGVFFVVTATLLRALKSIMQEKLLDPNEKSLDSVSLLYYMAPWAGGLLLVMSLVFEGLEPLAMLMPSSGKRGVGQLAGMLVLSGVNACFLNISGNLVTSIMGAVMLQILGNVKACLSIMVSTMIFQNPVTLAQALGVAVCLGGVWVYQRKGGVVSHTQQPKDVKLSTADNVL